MVLAAAVVAAVPLGAGAGTASAKMRSQISTPAVARVTVCGAALCAGQRWKPNMGSVNGLSDPTKAPGWAKDLGLNTLRLTDYLDSHASTPQAAFDPERWGKVDQLIAASGAAGLHVELDLSTYRNLLLGVGLNPYTYDWAPFIDFVARRVNTVTRVRYGNDPTIALVAFAGEVEPINGSNNAGVTTSELTNFFRTIMSRWANLAPRQLLTTGGLMQLDWNSGIDWRSIMALPHNAVPAIHVYSPGDRDITVPNVAAYATKLGKPWLNEEFGAPSSIGDQARADLFRSTYELTRRYGAAGVGIWNVGPEASDTYDVGPQFPLTFAAVRAH